MLCFVVAHPRLRHPAVLGAPELVVGVQIQNYFTGPGDYPLGAALAVVVVLGYLAIQG